MESQARDEGLGLEAILEVTKDTDTICPYETLVACGLWVGSPCLCHGAPVNIKGAWFGGAYSRNLHCTYPNIERQGQILSVRVYWVWLHDVLGLALSLFLKNGKKYVTQ